MAKRRHKNLTEKRTTLTLSTQVLRHLERQRDKTNVREGRTGSRRISLGDVATRMLEAAPYVRSDGVVVEPLKPHPPIESILGLRRVIYRVACFVAMKAANVKLEANN